MTIRPAWWPSFPLLMNDKPKSPWGSGGNDDDGPRNPWAAPLGNKPRNPRPTALDEFLRRARGPGGAGGGGGGFGGLPGGASGRSLWMIGAGLIALLWILLTSFHVIAPQQRGVVTFFGSYSGTLEPGFNVTLPAPIATAETAEEWLCVVETTPLRTLAKNPCESWVLGRAMTQPHSEVWVSITAAKSTTALAVAADGEGCSSPECCSGSESSGSEAICRLSASARSCPIMT